jgi:predicted lipoprotein with Yx(FWY)xxD motif
MRRIRTLSASVLLAVFGWGGIAGAQPRARAAASTTVQLAQTSRGPILVNGQGFTLYRFTRDTRHKQRCIQTSGCPEVWPYLDGSGSLVAGPGINAAELSTIALGYGARQVTYYGRPLYTYSRDTGPGDTSYFGAFQFGGYWFGLNAKGKRVH